MNSNTQTTPNVPIRILVIDDHRIVAEAFCTQLELAGDMEVVACVYETNQIQSTIHKFQPDIVLSDLEMPGGDPLELCIHAVQESPNSKIVVLTGYPTDVHIERAMLCDRVGGFLTKHEPAETIADGIRMIAAGHQVYSDEVKVRMSHRQGYSLQEPKILKLSPRELTIVRLVAQGMTTGQIAESVYRSSKTVDNQIASAFTKTGCSNRVELSRWAIREGLVQA